jgi:N,N'-diacetyllegionaminate synthase
MKYEFNKQIKISNFVLDQNSKTFIIAEAGVNHNGDTELAKKLIDAAVEAKADAVKFQTFKAHKLNTRKAPKSSYHLRGTPTDDVQSWFDLLRTQEISLEMHKELMEYCKEKNILFLSTPYDTESADLLDSLDIAAFKVASTDANNYPLLQHLGRTGRPIILSTAMSTLKEVEVAIKTIHETGNKNLILLHCTANYPADIENTNILAMKTLEKEFGTLVGYSDHCPKRLNPIAAVSLGAKVIEKHFTISKDLEGPDHQASLEPDELIQMVNDIRDTESLLGTGVKASLPCESENIKKLRKSVVIGSHVKKGDVLTAENLDIKRPGTGMAPVEYFALLGKTVNKDLPEDYLLTTSDFD